MTSVGEELPKLILNSQELLQEYIKIGQPGVAARFLIERDIREAIEAQASGDVVAILRSYKTLQGHA